MLRTIFIALLLITVESKAERLTINGTVLSDEMKPLTGVTVLTDVTGMATITDSLGRFALDYDSLINRISFSAVGFHSRHFPLTDLPDSVVMKLRYYRLSDITVTSDRIDRGVGTIAFDNVSRDEIERDLTVTEFPLLLQNTPNLYSYTDGGAPLGYSYLSIRGFNDQRIATYINGVPLNDPEDHFTYFVDIPDFGSNVTDVQVQRGVGNSLYGDASFGGSVNIVSSPFGKDRSSRLTTGFGALTRNGAFFGRQISKQSIEFSSGLVDGRWSYYGRYSRQSTSGFRENSWYNGWAYYFSVGRIDPKMSTELHFYGGPIRMHLAYRGVSLDDIKKNRLDNYLTYANETDNFNQPHFQIHNKYYINDKTTLSNSLYFIRGKGFFEQLKTGRTYSDYNLIKFTDSTSGDLVRRKSVEKIQIGWNPRLDIDHGKGRHSFGGSFYYFESKHWGQVISAEFMQKSVDPTHRYYIYRGKQFVGSAYVQEQFQLSPSLSMQATTQFRYIRHSLDQDRIGAFLGYKFTRDYFFFSPRLGLNYSVNETDNLFTNFAVSSRAPNDANVYDANDPEKFPQLEIIKNVGDTLFEFGDPTVKPERVYDIELGYSRRTPNYQFEVNLFWMRYENENLFEGGQDDFGRDITITVDRATHSGIELSSKAKIAPAITLSGSFSFNRNRINNYIADLSGTAVDFSDKIVAGFPEYIGNIIVEYAKNGLQLTWNNRFFGEQQMELENIDSLAIESYYLSSITASYTISSFLSVGDLTIKGQVNNLFDNKYLVSGYGGNYSGGPGVVKGWAEYFVAAERTFYGQLSITLF